MRWVATRDGAGRFAGLGLVEGEEVHLLDSDQRLIELLCVEGGLAGAAEAARRRPRGVRALATTAIGAPIDRPPSIRDFSAFQTHIGTIAKKMGFEVPLAWYEVPGFYFSNPAAVIGPDDDVTGPAGSQMLDYELEVGLVVGHHDRKKLASNPLTAIAGLMVMNDWSARDLQRHEMPLNLGPVKSKDFATSLGPMLVTLDELADYRQGGSFDLRMTARVNGVEYSAASLADIYYPLEALVQYAARDTVLVPGDVIGTGTCGTGCIFERSLTHGSDMYPWLRPGDIVELEVAQLGVLRNRIVQPKQSVEEA